MKKLVPFLLSGLTLVALSLGAFLSNPATKVNADGGTLEVDSKEEISFGRFVKTYDEYLSQTASEKGKDQFFDENRITKTTEFINNECIFEHKDEIYLLKENNRFTNAPDVITLSTGEYPKINLEQQIAIFKFEPIRWVMVGEEDGFTLYNSKNILFREQFDDQDETDYAYSKLLNVLNTSFFSSVFDDKEQDYLNLTDLGDNVKRYIDIPTKGQVGSFEQYSGPTDYVICSGLDLEESNGLYSYWTKTTDPTKPGQVVAMSGYRSPNDDTIGVRPLIRLKVQVKGGAGPTSPSGPTFNFNFKGNIALMIVGFIFLAGGLTFLVIFVVKWSKKLKLDPKYKHPWWYYLVLGITTTITIIGTNLFAYGTVVKFTIPGIPGVDGGHIYGLYVSGTYLDDDAGSEDWDWAGITHGIYALTEDGKVYHYIGNYPVGHEIPREEGEGSYVVNGNEITITFPETWRTFTFEHSPMTYKIDWGQNGWDIRFYLDYDVQFATQVVPLVSGTGLYNRLSVSIDHKPDGRPYYTTKDIYGM